ncbi:MAG: nucleotidyltransferase family protein [Eubacterium sp.]|nr:nucleotidyltransferase family protein [Eubacterium sp.]
MSNIAIIAEYNPFHNGHKYLVDYAKEVLCADTVTALMSGNFMQRGTPALADKYTRAEAALRGGVSIVFELPVLYATGSARDFAAGAVSILDKLNSVDGLIFGVEDERMDIFDKVSEILAYEPSEYKILLNNYLEKGYSYPLASEKAIVKMLGNEVDGIISKPNNILAISYITALKKNNSKIMPVMLKRMDEGYHSSSLSGNYSSATAIRKALSDSEDVRNFIPKACMEVYADYLKKPLPDADWLTPFIMSRIIYDRNLGSEISFLHTTLDMTPELLNRLRKLPLPVKYVEITDYLKTKNLTMTRVSRVLLHMVLGITDADRTRAYEEGFSEYVNLLALDKKYSTQLKAITDASDLTVINKKSEFKPETDLGKRMWQIDRLASDLYNQIIYDNTDVRLRSEKSSQVRTI